MARSTEPKGSSSQAKAPLAGLAASEQEILVRLGAAVLKLWDRLSRERQQELFASAVASSGDLDVVDLRKKMALILHANHERTGQAAREFGEQSHAPAGPHAAPHLTNYGATPGSGVLPGPRVGRGKGVDPGAG